MKIEEFVINKIEAFNESIKKDLRDKKIDASGSASRSLHTSQSGFVFSSTGSHYLEYLNRGRGPGKMPPLSRIQKWLNIRGGEVKLAYPVARKIAREGTVIYKDRTKGIMLEEKIKVLSEDINESLPKFLADNVKIMLNKAFKK